MNNGRHRWGAQTAARVRLRWLLPALLLLSCRFALDRSLSAGEIRGTVVFDSSFTGRTFPAAGARILVENASLSVQADERGAFVLEQLPAATYSLDISASSNGGATPNAGVHLDGVALAINGSTTADGIDVGVIVLGAFGGIQGTVVDGAKGVTGAFVSAAGLVQTQTAMGGYSFANVLPGQYSLFVFDSVEPGSAQIVGPVQVLVTPRVPTTVPPIDLGHATTVTMGSLAGEALLLGAASSKGINISVSGASSATGMTNAQGRYSFIPLAAGIYTVTASAYGYESVSVPSVLVGGSTTTVPTILLAPAAGGADAGVDGGTSNDAGPVVDGGSVVDGGPVIGGLFLAPVDYAAGMQPYTIATGDFNGDGKRDLAVANTASGDVSLLLGKGDGTFQPHVDYDAGMSPGSIAVADFNGDGKSDLAAGNDSSPSLTVFLGQADGTLLSTGTFATGTGGAPFVAAGDFDGDGRIDLAAADGSSGMVSILLGNGDGTFQGHAEITSAGWGLSLAADDFNGDGKADLAVGTSTNGVIVLLSAGGGLFQAPVTYPTNSGTYGQVRSILTGDLNGDGFQDIIAPLSQATSVSVMLGKGDGTFQPRVDYPSAHVASWGALGDFNGDGKPDLAVADWYDVGVLLGNGDGTLQPYMDYPTPSGEVINSVAAADFNGDGVPDLALANKNTVSVLIATKVSCEASDGTCAGTGSVCSGAFESPRSDATGVSPRVVAVGDLNGDGKEDAVVANSGSNTVSLLMGNGDGSFQAHQDLAAGNTPVWVAIGDLNGDGHQDLAIANDAAAAGTSGVTILLGTGGGAFATAQMIATNLSVTSLAIGDLNADGRLDLAITTGSSIGILPGNGDGTFQALTLFPTADYALAVSIADFNGDQKPDLAVGTGYEAISVLLGNGDGTFQAHVDYTTTSTTDPFGNVYSVIATDLNGDGKLDLAAANNGGASVLLGNGDGTFRPFTSYQSTGQARSVTTGDFNGDGKPDLAVASAGTFVAVLLGKGDGTFQGYTPYDVGVTATSVAAASFNGHATPDLIVVDADSNNVTVLLSCSP